MENNSPHLPTQPRNVKLHFLHSPFTVRVQVFVDRFGLLEYSIVDSLQQ